MALINADDHVVFNDWRDQRDAMDRAYLTLSLKNEDSGYPKHLWEYTKAVIDNYYPLKTRCIKCRSLFENHSIYRCYDCDAALCKTCMGPHFGSQHKPHSTIKRCY